MRAGASGAGSVRNVEELRVLCLAAFAEAAFAEKGLPQELHFTFFPTA